MATKKKRGYSSLRPHAARILKVAEFPMHVNGAYMDDPDKIPFMARPGRTDKP